MKERRGKPVTWRKNPSERVLQATRVIFCKAPGGISQVPEFSQQFHADLKSLRKSEAIGAGLAAKKRARHEKHEALVAALKRLGGVRLEPPFTEKRVNAIGRAMRLTTIRPLPTVGAFVRRLQGRT